MNKILILTLALVFFGWGCKQSQNIPQVAFTPVTPSGTAFLDPKGLGPDELAGKLTLAAGSVVSMKHTYTGAAVSLAKELKLGGTEAVRNIVIKRFAPGNVAEIEWSLTYKEGKTDQKITGSMIGSELGTARDIFPPAYWIEGEQNALGTGLIWTSSQVYENLSRSRLSTFDFGLFNSMIKQKFALSKAFTSGLKGLSSAAAADPRVDVFLAKADKDDIELPLKVNGLDTKVKAIKARSWFGEFAVLKNPQNPLVLYMHLNDFPQAGALNGLMNYDVTEIKDAPR
ncbi:MAG: hypothetical protein WC641_05565 [Patescibacteria group bacterium]